MANISTENINSLAQVATSVGDGDYVYIYKGVSNTFSRVEKSVFMQGAGAGEIDIESTVTGDLEIADSNGNVILRLVDGHVVTKEFSSSEVYSKNDADGRFVTSSVLNNYYTKSQVNNLINGGGGGSGGSASPLKLKILVIGNSFSFDSWGYVPFILQDYGIDIMVGIFYRDAASIKSHNDNYDTVAVATPFFHIDTETESSWQKETRQSVELCVQYTDWDIIVLQQGSTASVSSPSTEENSDVWLVSSLIGKILDTIAAKSSPKPVKFGWNINHSRYANDDSSAILSNCQTAINDNPVNIVFPYGTAVFDGRENDTLAALGTSPRYNMWCDGTHLQEGLPVYLAGITVVQSLFDVYYPQFSVMGDTFTPSASYWFPDINHHGDVIAPTAETRRLAQKCAIMANKFKYTVKEVI